MILLLLVQTCAAMLIPVETLVPILALKKTSDSNGFMMENKRTRTRHNYILQGDLDNDIDVPDNSISYSEPHDLINQEELPELIVDYANMIRNDIILLDNSVETRTRKRGNVKLRRSKEVVVDVPCTCEKASRETILLGDNYVPSVIETQNCDTSGCEYPYTCQERIHNVTVLKKKLKNHMNEESLEDLPKELKNRWISVKKPIVIGCFCVRDSDN